MGFGDGVALTMSAERDSTGRLLPGHNVRPLRRGGPSAAQLVAERLEPHRIAVLDKLAKLAAAGDPRSIETFLRYVAGPAEERVLVPGLSEATNLQARAHCVIAAVAAGECSATAGEKLLRALDVVARVTEIDELRTRLDRLEKRGVVGAVDDYA